MRRGRLQNKASVPSENASGNCTRAESVHLQERERNKAELTAAKAKHSQRAAAIEEELVALQQVEYISECCRLFPFIDARHSSALSSATVIL